VAVHPGATSGGKLDVATILYPTRGGDSTYRNQDRAAELAREQGASLLFLYVGNVHFLDHTRGPVHVEILEQELDEMAEFLLAMGQERAEKSGIQTDRLIKHGEFREALVEVVQENEVTAVVLGRPAHDTAHTTIEYISDFAKSITTELGVEAYVVHKGEIVEHYQPAGDGGKTNTA